MSDVKEAVPSQEEAWEIRKEEKRRKKEGKRDKKDGDSEEKPKKKRKREALPDELEIDVSLPEPVSKKEARKAKKAKSNPDADADGEASNKPKIPGQSSEDLKTASEKRSEFGVWIGNLPWSATKEILRTFLVEHSDITSEQITRVHMPAPTKPPNPNWTMKPLNRGFAYVDFADQLSMYAAIALTETKIDGRALLIKNAKSFEGRPDKTKAEETPAGTTLYTKPGHAPSKRVFVGNLSFDVTKEDLQTHYAQCGEVLDIHMATFEDSGKCKGYAWVTFSDVESATSAVNGFIFKEPKSEIEKKSKKSKKPKDGEESDEAEESDEESEEEEKPKKSVKKMKWFINRLMGRELRLEFAEDSTVRYQKRYGKKDVEKIEGVHPDRMKQFGDEEPRRPRQTPREKRPPRDPRTIKSGSAHMNAQRAPMGIVEFKGEKKTFA